MLDVNNLKLKLFEGHLGEVETAVNRWLQGLPNTAKVAFVGYNYQGPELDGQAVVNIASHGILLLVDMGTS